MGKELFWRAILGLDPMLSGGPFQTLQFCDFHAAAQSPSQLCSSAVGLLCSAQLRLGNGARFPISFYWGCISRQQLGPFQKPCKSQMWYFYMPFLQSLLQIKNVKELPSLKDCS